MNVSLLHCHDLLQCHDCYSLKTGLSVSGDIYDPAGWVLEALTPSAILACRCVQVQACGVDGL